MKTCVSTELSTSYLTMCWVLLSMMGSITFAVYQHGGSDSPHHTAILCPFRSAFALFGVADVLPCSMRFSFPPLYIVTSTRRGGGEAARAAWGRLVLR